MEKGYEVTLHRVVEHETVFKVQAESKEEAEDFVLNGVYDEVLSDMEIGEMEDPDVIDITRV